MQMSQQASEVRQQLAILQAEIQSLQTKGDALAWYSMLRPKSVYSWEDLRDKIMANFKGFSRESLTSSDFF